MIKHNYECKINRVARYILLFMFIYLNMISNDIIIVYEGKKRMCGGTTIYI